MAIYIVLNNFTDQGIRNIKDTTKRANDIREMGKKFGVTVKASTGRLEIMMSLMYLKRLMMQPWQHFWQTSVMLAMFVL